MAGSADRAINMALRVRGIGEVERDFAKVGKAGENAFTQVEKSANGADRAMSEYTARLKRVAAEARKAFDAAPGIAEARAGDPSGYIDARNKAILARVATEKNRITAGLPDMTQGFGAASGAIDGAAGSLARFVPIAGAVVIGLGTLEQAVTASAQAYMEHERALDSFHANLALAGNQSDATSGQIEDMAKRVVAATLQTEDSALKAAQVLATVPGITKEGLEAALDASSRLADALGTDVAQQAESTAAVLRALAEHDMKALISALDGVNPQLKATIYNLAEAGRTADAQKAYIAGLAQAAGDGPDGLTTASNRLSDAWTRTKVAFAEEFAGTAATGLNLLAGLLERVSGWSDTAAARWGRMASLIANPITLPIGLLQLFGGGGAAKAPQGGGMFGAVGQFAETIQNRIGNLAASSQVSAFEKKYGGGAPHARGGGGGGGRSGKSEAEREAEQLKREAEQARQAADRVVGANDDVVASYALRAKEAEEKVGLEGEALKAVERRQALDAIVRRINREEIEKEVAAQKAAAAQAGKQFDEAAATKAATAAVDAKSAALRENAARELDAADAIAEFAKRQAEAKAILEGLKTPLDHINDQIETAIGALRKGDITADDFNHRMDQLAGTLADVRYESDKSAQAWRGFGDDVGRTLADIALHGGSAMEILQKLIQLPLERLLQQNLANPVADWIDGLTGNNRDKNVAAARASLPDASKILGSSATVVDPAAQGAAVSLNQVQVSATAAAQGLQAVALSAGNPIDDLAFRTDAAAQAMGALTPQTQQFGNALMQLLSQLGAGGGGGSGALGSLLSIGLAAFGGGAAPQASLVGSVNGAIAANPGLFASGTDRLPVGRKVWLGENGRELAEALPGGGLRVYSNQQARRMVSEPVGGPAVVQHITIPERADPRRTASGIARSTQSALARSAAKGLAVGPRFARDR